MDLWLKFLATRIKLWRGLLALAICLGIVIGSISLWGGEAIDVEPAPNVQFEIEVRSLQEQIATFEQRDIAIQNYILMEIKKEELAILEIDVRILEVKTILLSLTPEQYITTRGWQKFNNELQTLYQTRSNRQGRISAYQKILKEFYGETPNQ